MVGLLSAGVIFDSVCGKAGIETIIGDLWVVLRVIVLYIRLLVLIKNRQNTEIEGIAFNSGIDIEIGDEEAK